MRGRRSGFKWSATIAAVAAATGLVAVSGFAGTSGATGEPVPAAFRLADGSVACRLLDAGALACRSARTGHGAMLEADGASRPTEAEVVVDADTPVLLPAQSWWNGAFSCRVAGGLVRCAAGDGAITVGASGAGGVR